MRKGCQSTGQQRICLALLVLVCLAAPSGATGQVRENSIEFWGAWAGWNGSEAEDFDWGPATGILALFDAGWIFDPGFELGFAGFDLNNPEIPIPDADEFEASVVARRWLRTEGLRPFLGLRGGYTRLSSEVIGFRFEQVGVFGGGGLGGHIPLGDRIRIAATAEALRYHYSEAEFFLDGVTAKDTSGSAWRFWLRLGLAFRWRS